MVCIMQSLENDQSLTGSSTGYGSFFPNATDYEIGSSPRSWALVPAVRHAMTLYPYSTFFFILSPHALIMNPSLSLDSHVMAPKRIESIMLKEKPVVPPDSVIKTFSHLKGDKIDLVLTQDNEGLCQGSFIIRSGEWAKFFLDTWFDPLYRSYNFQKAEGHALVRKPIPRPSKCHSECLHDAFYNKEKTNNTKGAHRPMASHNPNQASPRPPTPP